MLPIRDHNPSGATPFVTNALIGLNLVAFLRYVDLFGSAPTLAGFFDR
jgi:hypothetical protein